MAVYDSLPDQLGGHEDHVISQIIPMVLAGIFFFILFLWACFKCLGYTRLQYLLNASC